MKAYPLLESVDSPADLRAMDESALESLAQELREFLLETVARTGGHLAPGLGTVELAIALHRVFETPHDRLVWDIGHQAYPHKILTGRRERMASIRQRGGLAGFLSREESVYDTFGAGHSSTSISAALGMAVAHARRGDARPVVAIIGDGAMTAGLAYEALNNAGVLDTDMLVILNDNAMSISPNVGAMQRYLAKVLAGRFYRRVREGGKTVLAPMPALRAWVRRWEEHVKGMMLPGTLFEELGFNYVGPLDGHDLPLLLRTLENLREMRGPRLLHVVTQKGRGYYPAEQGPCGYHGVAPFDRASGKVEKKGGGRTFTNVFSDWVCDMAAADERLVAITPAMCEGSGLERFAQSFPDRNYDVGIAEQHALTFAAGLACEGDKPVVAIYSTFLQRAYDQLIHDVCLQGLDVTFAIDRAGLVGADGATHHGAYDLSFMRCIPGLVIAAPSDEAESRRLLSSCFRHVGPAAVRYPRGGASGVEPVTGLDSVEVGKGVIRRRGVGVAILAFGTPLAAALEAAERIDASVADMRFVKPLDIELIAGLAASHALLVTVEDGAIAGGAGSAVAEWLAAAGIGTPVAHAGLPDAFIEHATQAEQRAAVGIDAAGLLRLIAGAQGRADGRLEAAS